MPLTTTLAGGSAPGFLPFYDPFNRANGPLVAPWQSGGATWTIVSNEAINTPTEGVELLANGSFANWTGDSADDWIQEPVDGANHEVCQVGTGQGHAACGGAGVGFCNTWKSGGAGVTSIRQVILTAGRWYCATVTIDTVNSGTIDILGLVDAPIYDSTGNKVMTSRASAASFRFRTRSDPTDITIDDASVKQLTLNTLFSNVETGTADVVCQVELDTVVADTQAGLVLNLDDKDAPANFVIAYHDGTNARLEKCVAGTYTSVISAAAAYAAGAIIQVTKSGTDYTLTYNSAQVGATSTISNAGIIGNSLHGMFSTYGGNQLDNFQCVRA